MMGEPEVPPLDVCTEQTYSEQTYSEQPPLTLEDLARAIQPFVETDEAAFRRKMEKFMGPMPVFVAGQPTTMAQWNGWKT